MLHFIVVTIVVVVFSAAVLAGLYVLSIKVQARLEVKSQPREAFYECPTHGVMRKKHLITHLDQQVCPYCWSERVKTKLDSTIF